MLFRSFSSTLALVRDQSFLQGLGDVIRATEDSENVATWATNMGASFVPNAVRGSLRAYDGTRRDTHGDVLARAFPVLRDAPVAHDLWGRPLQEDQEHAFSDVLWRMTVPVRTEEAVDVHDLDAMLYRWNASASKDDQYYPALPARSFQRDGVPVEMTNDEYQTFVQRAGTRARLTLEVKARDGGLNLEQPTADDIGELRAHISAGRGWARKYPDRDPADGL